MNDSTKLSPVEEICKRISPSILDYSKTLNTEEQLIFLKGLIVGALEERSKNCLTLDVLNIANEYLRKQETLCTGQAHSKAE